MTALVQLPDHSNSNSSPIVQAVVRQIQRAASDQITGSLNFDTVHVPRMRLFFVMGRLIWAGGGVHRLRRWNRLLKTFCPEAIAHITALSVNLDTAFWEYTVLGQLVKAGHISRDVARSIIQANIVEVLFDIVQASKLIEKFSYTKTNLLNPQDTITLIAPETLIQDLERQWGQWCEVNLAPYSPNLAPAVTRPGALQSQVTPQTYEKLMQMLKGHLSLRELALLLQKDVCHFSQSIIAYEQQGIVQLQVIPDLGGTTVTPTAAAHSSGRSTSAQEALSNLRRTINQVTVRAKEPPLVMCIDDSPIICQRLQQIVERAGYRYTSIQDPIQALPLLLSQKPDLIFVDLVMPVIGGYELCSQIRRLPSFQDTPLIIFSGNMIDRIRAKLVRANDILAKDVPSEQITATIERWLPLHVDP